MAGADAGRDCRGVWVRGGYWAAPGSRPAVLLTPGLECGWLFTTLSIQLLVAVTGASAIECCSNCRSFYLPKKVASTGKRRFCPKCGIRAARRLAQADFRKRHGG